MAYTWSQHSSNIASGLGDMYDAFQNASLITKFASRNADQLRSQGAQAYQTAQDNIKRLDVVKRQMEDAMTENLKDESRQEVSAQGSIRATGAVGGDVNTSSSADVAKSQSMAYYRQLYQERYNLASQQRDINTKQLDLDLSGSMDRRNANLQANEVEWEASQRASAMRSSGLVHAFASLF